MLYLLIHFFASTAMMGLIWLVQLVHYPAFRFVDEKDYISFALFHTTQITWVVAPLMIAELFSAFLMSFDSSVTLWVKIVSIICLVAIWLSTVFFQIPQHSVLALGKNLEAIENLVTTNWIRTIAWTIKSFVLGFELLRLFKLPR
ncbi:MAG: hypothetical protein K2P81_01325 [Bacteriovoracaceae bacterium]|nr:hypothetical protein [Bacteriovoracaceae bacterium]